MKQHRYKQFKQFDFSKNNPLVKKVLSINYILNLFKKKKKDTKMKYNLYMFNQIIIIK